MGISERILSGRGGINSRYYRLLYLNTGEAIAGMNQIDKIKAQGTNRAFIEVNIKNFSPCIGVRQIDKKISSSRPLRTNSGGKPVMSLLVQTINTLLLRSAIQVNSVPNTRLEVPLSPLSWAMPFSISSSHNTQGDIVSANVSASRKLRSVSPKTCCRAPQSRAVTVAPPKDRLPPWPLGSCLRPARLAALSLWADL